MRAQGIVHLLGWRWAPCAALVAGSLSFVAFVSLAIPERIGNRAPKAGAASLGAALTRAQGAAGSRPPSTSFGQAADDEHIAQTSHSPAEAARAARASHEQDGVPKRGFTPPLERPEAPPPPPTFTPQQPVLAEPPQPSAPEPPPAVSPTPTPAPESQQLVPPPSAFDPNAAPAPTPAPPGMVSVTSE